MKKPSKTRFCSFPELIDNIWTLEVDIWFPYKNPATQMPPTIMNVILSDSIGAVVLRLNEWPEIPREENASWVEDAESLYMSWSELRIRVVGHLLIFIGFAKWKGGHYAPMKYYPQGWHTHKRYRKWTFQNETKTPWKSEFITLKNKKVRALFRISKNHLIFFKGFRQKTPEMSELEADKYAVKIWAHNFEKQKS